MDGLKHMKLFKKHKKIQDLFKNQEMIFQQNNAIKCQPKQFTQKLLNDLKINLLRVSYSEENLIDQRKNHYNIQNNQILKNSNQYHTIRINQIRLYHHIYRVQKQYITQVRDVPIDMEEQGKVENMQYVQTHVGYVKQYLEDIKLIVKNQYQYQFLQIINLSIYPSPFEIMRFFRLTVEMLEQSLDGGFIYQAVLNLEIFSAIQYLQIFETDDRWQEFDEEHTELALELSELIFNHLITKVIIELKI